MNAKQKEPSWLKGVLNRGEQTLPYHFDDGDKRKAKISDDLNVLAQNVARRNADVQVVNTMLIEASNHIVQLQGELAKAEIAAEAAETSFWKAAREMMGVSVPKQE